MKNFGFRLIPVMLMAVICVTLVLGQNSSTNDVDRSERSSREDRGGRSRSRESRRSSGNTTKDSDPLVVSTNVTDKSQVEAFAILSHRNVFNANRGPRSSRISSNEPPPKPKVIDSFALVGTLLHGGAQHAYIDGSSSAFRRSLSIGETIGGLKLLSINKDSVKFDSKGKEVEVWMGMQMKREDEGEWTLSGRSVLEGAMSSGNTKSAGGDDSTSTSSGGEEDEILKRLMRKREQESK